jgi:hypothetical protein
MGFIRKRIWCKSSAAPHLKTGEKATSLYLFEQAFDHPTVLYMTTISSAGSRS